jgi:hypothetical protein
MLFWPVVAVVGFVVLAALVVALATSSTARYEFEKNRVQGQQQAAAVRTAVGAVAAGSGADVTRPAVTGETGAAEVGTAPTPRSTAAVPAASHPAGKRVGSIGTPAWWLVAQVPDGVGEMVVAGPFADRIEAEWAALADGAAPGARAVHGVQRGDGRVLRRQLPEERAWLSELGDQLDRLPEEWDSPLIDEDALVTLVVEVASALVESGLSLHDCAGDAPAGGVCLSPEPTRPGIVVSWHQHERMSVGQFHGREAFAAVQRTMNTAVADTLRQLGFAVEPFGSTGCCLVTGGDSVDDGDHG